MLCPKKNNGFIVESILNIKKPQKNWETSEWEKTINGGYTLHWKMSVSLLFDVNQGFPNIHCHHVLSHGKIYHQRLV